MTFRPRSAAWSVALASAAALLAAAAFALAPGSPETASAAACDRGHGAKRGLIDVLRRERCRRAHLPATRENADPPAAPCAPTLFAPAVFDTNEGTNFSPLPLRATGTLPAVMLFVDFADRPAAESTERLYASLVPRARSWFAETSYGRAALEVTPLHRWLRMARVSRAYALRDGASFDEQRAYVAEAVSAADPSFDFSPYKIVYVVASSGSGLERSAAFHAMAGSGIAVDGTELRFGSTFGDDIRTPAPDYPANVLVHETGHVLGLPDLYDTTSPVYPAALRHAGGWDPMSWAENGAHFLAWHKWKLGWLDQGEITCLHAPGSVTTTLTPLARRGGLKAIVIPTGPSSTLVIEARRKVGHDRRLCEQGVVVYSVDATVSTGNGPVRLHAAQRDRSAERIHQCGLLSEAPFDRGSGEASRFTDPAAGVTMQVLGSSADGYRVRVTRT